MSKTTKKIPRSTTALAAKRRRAELFKDKRQKREGARNFSRDFLEDYDDISIMSAENQDNENE